MGDPSRSSRQKMEARKAVEFLQSSGLVDLKMPVERVVGAVSKLDEVAGYVLAWERYVLVVADIAEIKANPGT
ncbi:MAG: hypothetical protein JNL98_08440 [Bryobacterales bacterium]|nr:hypothetical protein [Bryobacterales bacterium]